MLTVFLKIASIFAMIGIGFISNKSSILTLDSNKHLINLILYITNPCLIISTMSSQPLTTEIARQGLEILLGSAVFFLATSLVAFLIVKILRYEPTEDRGVLMVIMTAVNTGFMGFPITKAFFGNHFFFLMVIENVALNFYLFFLAYMILNSDSKKRHTLKEMIKPLFNMITGSIILGLVIMLTGFKMPNTALDFFDTVGNATIPVSMIVVGLQLAQSDISKMLRNIKLVIVSLCKVTLIPFLTFLAVNWLPMMNESKLIIIFAACFPCAVITVAIAAQENKNSTLMAEGVAITTLFSLGTLPVAAMLLMNLYC